MKKLLVLLLVIPGLVCAQWSTDPADPVVVVEAANGRVLSWIKYGHLQQLPHHDPGPAGRLLPGRLRGSLRELRIPLRFLIYRIDADVNHVFASSGQEIAPSLGHNGYASLLADGDGGVFAAAGIAYTEYRVVAHPDTVWISWECLAALGDSVDNLEPGAPQALTALRQPDGSVGLTWVASGCLRLPAAGWGFPENPEHGARPIAPSKRTLARVARQTLQNRTFVLLLRS